MGRRNARKSVSEAAERAAGGRLCDWPDCRAGTGEFRAPRSRDTLDEYYWFCLEHIRQYNAAWNYYAGMTDDEVEADVRRDTVWHRPSWPLGGNVHKRTPHAKTFKDPFGFFDDAEPDAADAQTALNGFGLAETQALVVLDLRPPITVADVKTRYKELVKRHHPDANGGDKLAEEKFKQISNAYETIMNSLAT